MICKKFVKFCKTCIFFANFLANSEKFKNFSRIFSSKTRQRDDRCSSSKIFKFTTENFLIFHFFEKNLLKFFDFSDFSEFFRIVQNFWKNSWKIFGREAPGKTQTRNIWRARPQPPAPLFRKKNWPTPRRVLDLIILGRLSKLFSKKLRAKRAPLRHPLGTP